MPAVTKLFETIVAPATDEKYVSVQLQISDDVNAPDTAPFYLMLRACVERQPMLVQLQVAAIDSALDGLLALREDIRVRYGRGNIFERPR